MGTRGIFGYKVDGKYYLMYNHFDSYPEGLGKSIAEIIQKINATDSGWHRFRENAKKVTLIKEDIPASPELVEKYRKYSDESVSSRQLEDWYVLLRETQNGKALEEIFKGELAHLLDASGFVHDSLVCEFGYIINLDTYNLELFRGFQQKPQLINPFGIKEFDGYEEMKKRGYDYHYYPIKLIGTIPLGGLVTTEAILKIFDEEEKKEEAEIRETDKAIAG